MERYTEHIKNETFDVIIIGGGITGAAIAYEAASRGLSVVLFEKGDFSEATSAASSKLIHGGLRYLNNLEYRLVWESLRERRTMSNIAPNFVYPFPMLLPHYRSSLKSNKWLIRIGLIQYDFLAVGKTTTWDKSKSIPGHKAISAEEALRLQPVISKNGLTGASIFYDCISICPERLALAFMKTALHYGARAANHARVTAFLQKSHRVCGVRVCDLIEKREIEVLAPLTINCAGPWADSLLNQLLEGKKIAHLQRSEGIHIITRQVTKENSVVSAFTPGGRHCFLIPWRGHTLIGTTDKPYKGHPDNYRVTRKSILELLQTVNTSFEGLDITYDDILHTYGGLRPLLQSGKRETYRSSRKYEIHDNASEGIDGLLTVEGGKWTTSRGLAEKVVDRLKEKTGRAVGPSISDRQYLKGSRIHDLNDFLNCIQKENPDFSENTIDCLGRLYGQEYKRVLSLARNQRILARRLNRDGELLAQVVYGVRHEMARTLKDIVLRRTGIGTLGNPGEEILFQVARIMAQELNWNEKEILKEVESTSNFLRLP
ncbi:MAG: glycerol-3-phosphate dehydrogenase/oxidase [Deltaproteobacteria bacterium]|nr:glycerol-3-phosphate dehydrogenase/oxidase [Deltaproteobacteria bacterium]